MAIRNIRMIGDDILTKKCKVVKEMTEKNKELIADMFDTMYDADGVGLAAPQVGILKRIAVIDITEDRSNPIVLINPEIISTDGEQRGSAHRHADRNSDKEQNAGGNQQECSHAVTSSFPFLAKRSAKRSTMRRMKLRIMPTAPTPTTK